jgi:hypothetical protein
MVYSRLRAHKVWGTGMVSLSGVHIDRGRLNQDNDLGVTDL